MNTLQQQEEWRDIPSAPNYQASSLGRIRSLCFNNRMVSGRYQPRIRKLALVNGNSLMVDISVSGVRKFRSVHRLVREAFHGSCPDGKECAHWNGNSLDNRPQNLRWATKSENNQDKFRHGTAMFGDKTKMAKLRNGDISVIRKRLEAGERCCDIARDYPIEKSAISKIKRGLIWRHVT
jgi:hypothetical protein